jgi:hypothetical protein
MAFNQNQRPANTPNIGSGVQNFLFPVVIVLLLYLGFLFAELLYKYMNRLAINRVELLPNTYTVGNKTITIPQNPNLTKGAIVQLSDNERTGMEFTYTFYLNIDPSTIDQQYDGLKHIFHMGYATQFPLLAPGVYMRSNINTLRVYMNTYKTWNNYREVENIPLSKWVHVAIVCKDNALEIFINGNLSKKKSFEGSVIYQNYQDIICFSKRKIDLTKTMVPSADDNGFIVHDSAKGMLSRLTYFNYALCYAEIQKDMEQGPSSQMDDSNLNDVPPYLADTWWAHHN